MNTKYNIRQLIPSILFVVVIITSACETQKDAKETIDEEQHKKSEIAVTSLSDCKTFKKNDTIPNTMSCLLYSYNTETSTLTLNHVNTVFNCCPDEVFCTALITGDTILITETESEALCNCNCLYDIGMEIENLPLQNWFIKVDEPYIGNNENINGFINLLDNTDGFLCFPRNGYPWN